MSDLPKDGRTYRIWSVVEELVLSRNDQLQGERMRDSYYLLREWLEPKRDAGEIKDAEFDYFVDNYEYYRDSFWPRMEKKHGLRRPMTKPPTVVIERGNEYTESRIVDEEAWRRARGFIFVEKSGMAEDLAPLSNHGWFIVAAQGESTRTFREKVAGDGTNRPILVVTDADFYGGGITESLKGHSERTEHLGLWRELENRVIEIGLTREDAASLDLPRERDPTQSPDKWRVELNALTVLKERESIKNPLMSYVVAKMDELDMPLCPLPYDDLRYKVRRSLYRAIQDSIEDAVDGVIDEVLEDIGDVEAELDDQGVGEVVQIRHRRGGGDVDLSSVKEDLQEVAEDKLNRIVLRRRSRYEKEVKQQAGQDAVEWMEANL